MGTAALSRAGHVFSRELIPLDYCFHDVIPVQTDYLRYNHSKLLSCSCLVVLFTGNYAFGWVWLLPVIFLWSNLRL
jgi:hypothetical protein